MKGVSFSLGSRNSSSSSTKKSIPKPPTHKPDTQKDFVTEFDSSKPLPNSQHKTLIIPPQPNEWQPFKKMKNLQPPIEEESTTNQPLQFETATETPGSESGNISYGLNLRKSEDTKITKIEESYEPIDRVMVKNLKDDLDKLPEDQGFDEFDDVPVDGFGAALLKGYGWYQGRGVGKNIKEDVKVVEYERRAGKEGLGFVATLPSSVGNGEVKASERREKKERSGLFVGKDVRIVGGRDMGLKGRVLEVMGDTDYVVLMVVRNGKESEVKVRGRDVADLGSLEEERCLKKMKELEIDDKRKGRKISRGDRREEKPVKKDKVSWLTSNIKVRIISKKLKGGRLYLKKGTVVDVVGPSTCDISMDESRELIQGVDQELLETALPGTGGPVLVLYGKHKGVYGSLLKKDREKETAVVEDADSRKPLHVLLEQIAEYIGDPSEMGY